jgi:hypothetical protein
LKAQTIAWYLLVKLNNVHFYLLVDFVQSRAGQLDYNQRRYNVPDNADRLCESDALLLIQVGCFHGESTF